MKKIAMLFIVLFPLSLFAQEKDKSATAGGDFAIGLRSTASVFGNQGYPGLGVGGQFRLKFGQRINSEWFADYITTDLDNSGLRQDAHIGWSVMFYPFNPEAKVQPYLLAGHCFDYTDVSVTNSEGTESKNRLSSATQMGLGTHFHLNDQFNISLSGQYMLHLGNDIHVEHVEVNGTEELHIAGDHSHGGEEHIGLEGHILLTLSVNYRIADLW